MELPLAEITLRKYEEPYKLDERELVKKICLSIGLLQPGDSRDIIVDIFQVLLEARKQKQFLSIEKIKEKTEEKRKKAGLDVKGLALSNIRRQLKRLRDLMIIEKISNEYRMSEFESLESIFKKKIESFLLPSITERIKQYIAELEKY